MRRSFWSMVMASAAGAAVAHFFDPDNGHERRERLRRRLEDGAADLADAQDQLHGAVNTVATTVGGNGSHTEDQASRTDPLMDALASGDALPDIGGVTNPPIR
jgi:hypothetical protein